MLTGRKLKVSDKETLTNLFIFETSTDIAQLFVNTKSFLFFVPAITHVGDEDGATSHTWQRHLHPTPINSNSEAFLTLDPNPKSPTPETAQRSFDGQFHIELVVQVQSK